MPIASLKEKECFLISFVKTESKLRWGRARPVIAAVHKTRTALIRNCCIACSGLVAFLLPVLIEGIEVGLGGVSAIKRYGVGIERIYFLSVISLRLSFFRSFHFDPQGDRCLRMQKRFERDLFKEP